MDRRSPGLRRTAAIIAAAALALLVSTPSALALVPIKTDTSIVVNDPGGPTVTYSGRLVTKLAKGKATEETRRAARRCLKAREVRIEGNAGVVAKTRSNAKGNWSVTGAKVPPGLDPRVVVSREIRGDVLCGIILKHFET